MSFSFMRSVVVLHYYCCASGSTKEISSSDSLNRVLTNVFKLDSDLKPVDGDIFYSDTTFKPEGLKDSANARLIQAQTTINASFRRIKSSVDNLDMFRIFACEIICLDDYGFECNGRLEDFPIYEIDEELNARNDAGFICLVGHISKSLSHFHLIFYTLGETTNIDLLLYNSLVLVKN